jgi:hypothetical protein
LAEKKEEEEQDYWFNRLWPMTKPKQTWWEKWLAREENGSSDNISGEEEVEFRAPVEDVAELTLGAGHAVFEKTENPGAHMKPLFIEDI